MSSRFSRDLKVLLDRMAQHPLTLGEILEETHDRSFSLIIALLVLPFLVPVPPGFTTLPSLACLLLSLQMAIGRRSPWLPQRVARFHFPKALIGPLLSGLQRLTRLLEKVVRPRWPQIAENRRIWNINGLCISWLTLLLMSPVPFTNQLFSGSILIFAVATLEADGLLMCVGYGMTCLVTTIFGVLIYGSMSLLR